MPAEQGFDRSVSGISEFDGVGAASSSLDDGPCDRSVAWYAGDRNGSVVQILRGLDVR